MASSDRIDISVEMEALCDKLGLAYKDVLNVFFTPSEVIANVGVRRNGSFHIDEQTNEQEIQTRKFKVRT